MDVDNIPPGADFVEVIEEAVGNCDVFLALIGPEWVNARNASGVRRLDDPGDFVRLEIAAALERGIKVVPLLLRGAEMPAASDLPPEIAWLARREALELSDKRWQQDVGRLERAMHRTTGRAEGATDVKASPAPPVTEPVPTPPEPSTETLTPTLHRPPRRSRRHRRRRGHRSANVRPTPAREPKPERERKPKALKPKPPIEPGGRIDDVTKPPRPLADHRGQPAGWWRCSSSHWRLPEAAVVVVTTIRRRWLSAPNPRTSLVRARRPRERTPASSWRGPSRAVIHSRDPS